MSNSLSYISGNPGLDHQEPGATKPQDSRALFSLQPHQQRPAHPKEREKKKSYSTTHFSFMMLALKPSTANTTRVASTDVKKLMKETRVASKWQLLSCLL